MAKDGSTTLLDWMDQIEESAPKTKPAQPPKTSLLRWMDQVSPEALVPANIEPGRGYGAPAFPQRNAQTTTGYAGERLSYPARKLGDTIGRAPGRDILRGRAIEAEMAEREKLGLLDKSEFTPHYFERYREGVAIDLGLREPGPGEDPPQKTYSPEAYWMAQKYKGELAKAPKLPGPPKNAEQWLAGLGADLGAFVAEVMVARKLVPTSVAKRFMPKKPTALVREGITTAGAFGAVGQVREPSEDLTGFYRGAATGGALVAGGSIAGLAGESAAFASMVAAQGGSWEDILIAALLPGVFRGSRAIRNLYAGKLRDAKTWQDVRDVEQAANAIKQDPEIIQRVMSMPKKQERAGLFKWKKKASTDPLARAMVDLIEAKQRGELAEPFEPKVAPTAEGVRPALPGRIAEPKPKSTEAPSPLATKPKPDEPLGMPTAVPPAAETPHGRAARAMAEDPLGTEGDLVRPQDIVRKIEKEFNLPIKARFIRGKMAAAFFPLSEHVRMKEQNQVLSAIHELGHYVYKKHLGGKEGKIELVNPEARAELLAAGKALYGKRKPTGGYAREGVAEYLVWRLSGDRAPQEMPNFHAEFERATANDPHLRAVLDWLGANTRRWIAQGAEARFEAKIITKKPLRLSPSDIWTRLRSHLEDPGYILKRIRRVKGLEGKLRPSKDPYELQQFGMMTAASKALKMAIDGPFDLSGNLLGPSLQEVLAPVVRAGKYDAWERWAVAVRTLRAYERGLKPGWSKEDAEFIVNKYKDEPDFGPALKGVTEWANKAVLDYLIDAGALSPNAKTAMRAAWPDYVPFRRFREDLVRGGRGTKEGFVRLGKGVRPFQEGGEPIVGLVEGLLGNAERAIGIADKTRVAIALRNLAQEQEGMGQWIHKVTGMPAERLKVTLEHIKGEIEALGGDLSEADMEGMVEIFLAAKDYLGKENIVPIYDPKAEKLEFWELEPNVYRALTGMDRQQMPLLLRPLAMFTRAKRLGITGLNIGFSVIRNPLVDIPTFLFQTKGPSGPAGLGRWVYGLYDTLLSEVSTKARLQKGGAGHFRRLGGEMSHILGLDRNMKNAVQEVLASTPQRKALNVIEHPVEFFREVLSSTEISGRTAEFRTLYEKGLKKPGWTEADAAISAFNAGREVTGPFFRLGHTARWINQMVAYFNPQNMGLAQMMRTVRHNPTRSFVRGAVGLTLGGLLYWWAVKDEDWWKRQPGWQKWGFFSQKIGDTVWRLPVPFEWGYAFYSIPIGVLDAMYRQDPQTVRDVMGVVAEGLVPPAVPQSPTGDGLLEAISDLSLVGPAAEVAAGKVGFTKRPIVPARTKRLVPEEQFYPWTSEAAKWLGKKAGRSPAELEHMAESLTGGLATDVVRTIEQGASLTDRTAAADLPVIGRFATRPGSPGQAQERYYTLLNELGPRKASGVATREEKIQLRTLELANVAIRKMRTRLWNMQSGPERDYEKEVEVKARIEKLMQRALDLAAKRVAAFRERERVAHAP